jgi:hypothetical protein
LTSLGLLRPWLFREGVAVRGSVDSLVLDDADGFEVMLVFATNNLREPKSKFLL